VPEDGDTANARCFVSLDGVSFLTGAMPTTAVTLEADWGQAAVTSAPAVGKASGVVSMQGSIATEGAGATAFILPPAYRPVTNVYLPVTLCEAHHGQLKIAPNGAVTVSASDMIAANCMTSLDGVTFVQ
jgi:hypothetical protein